MKTRLLLCALGLMMVSSARISQAADAPLPPDIENEQTLAINTQPWHATLMPYANLTEALKADRYASTYARSLNGTWKFHYVPRPEGRPVDFYKPSYDVSKWDNLTVPSNWQLHGYGTPYYRNNGYTFQRDWPRVMSEPPKNYTSYEERNPVGSYRRDFTVPATWDGRRVFLTFDGVDAGFYLWINGKQVGYSTNSRNAAEFDITPYLQRGNNTLAVEVYRYTSGSYLEDQDMWRLSGIFRNVTLWSAPTLHLRDFKITTDLDAQYRNATMTITGKVRNYGGEATPAYTFGVALYDRNGRAVPDTGAQINVPPLQPGQESSPTLIVPVDNPAKWTAETPNLYTAVLSLQGDGRREELISQRVGFREIEVKGRLFCVNGVPIKLKGANRHENWPDTGHYVTEARMIRDIELLKQANCNHVRTCHYSDDPHWYELCDQYGLYLVAEANVECHGYYNVLDREPRYEKAIVDRNVANVENFKNHPSIIIWSMGNECGGGSNLRAAERMVRGLDATRPTHYEAFGIGDNNPAGIDSQMYTGVDNVERIAQSTALTKPFYLCEYAHAMFNSMGAIGEYNDVFDKYPSLLGGAIWEWEDQGIENRRDPKRQYIAYGGGFGEVPNDGYFIHKGVVDSNRNPKPHYPEVKRAYQWIGFAPLDLARGQIKIKNKYAFTNLNRYAGAWTLTEDGSKVQGGALPRLNLAPGQETTVVLPLKSFARKAGAHYLLNVDYALANDELWAKAGYEIANAQFPLDSLAPSILNASAMKPLALAKNAGAFTVTGQNFSLGFDRTQGTFSSLTRDGMNLLLPNGGPQLHLWRAQHRNDDGYAARDWDSVSLRDLKAQVISTEATQVSPSVVRLISTVRYTGTGNFSVVHTASYTIYGDGSVAVDNAVSPQGPNITLARVGVRMLLDKRLSAVSYFARGPMENYSDRKRGSDLGVYGSSVVQQMTPYSKPMDNGNHEDMAWLHLKGKGTPSLLVQADATPLQFSALPYRDEEMEPAAYTVDLPQSSATVLCVSGKTLGVGSASCGPRPLPQYLVDCTPRAFSYVLRLLPNGNPNITALTRQLPPSNRLQPVLARRNGESLVTLTTANVGTIEYSRDATQWQPYTAPFAFEDAGTLYVRSTQDGQSITNTVTFDAPPPLVTASTFERGEGDPSHLVDGSRTTFWHSRYSPQKIDAPHFVVIDFRKAQNMAGLTIVPRQDMSNGRVKDYEVYLSNDGQNWGEAVLKGVLPDDARVRQLKFAAPQNARYLKFMVLSDHSGQNFGAIAELTPIIAP